MLNAGLMNTMHPVVVMGSYRWDEELLPIDEFEERLRQMRALMASEGWDGLVVNGDCGEGDLLFWLTNFAPRLRWAAALLGPSGPPRLLMSGATRDLPASNALTWCRPIESYNEADTLVRDWAAKLRPDGRRPRVGVVGLSRIRDSVHETLAQALGQSERVDADAAVQRLLVTPRWRELMLLRQAYRILGDAAQTLEASWRAGAPIQQACVDAERRARLAQAHDVRVLFSTDGGATLIPIEGVNQERSERLVAYLAVRYLGVWADAFVTRTSLPLDVDAEAECALQSRLVALQAGMPDSASEAPAGLLPHPMLRCADPLDAAPEPDDSSLPSVCRVRAGWLDAQGRGALHSATLVRIDGQWHSLYPSPPAPGAASA